MGGPPQIGAYLFGCSFSFPGIAIRSSYGHRMLEPLFTSLLWLADVDVQLIIYAGVFLCALLIGAAPERLLASIILGMAIFDKVHHMMLSGSLVWHRGNLGHLIIDIVVLGGTIGIALYANRIYPLWIAAAHIISLFGHIYRMTLEEINGFAYDMMAVAPSCIQLAALVSGIVCHAVRRSRLGNYRSWRA